jgi:hypothetical protein
MKNKIKKDFMLYNIKRRKKKKIEKLNLANIFYRRKYGSNNLNKNETQLEDSMKMIIRLNLPSMNILILKE